jgi:hypothetical protein
MLLDIQNSSGPSFDLSNDEVNSFLEEVEITRLKAKSVDKSDLFLTVNDPRAAITRRHIGFSIKSEFGHDPTLFNTAKASALVYKVTNMDDYLMAEINNIYDARGHVAVSTRCSRLIERGCYLTLAGTPIASRSGYRTFEENLDLVDPRLLETLSFILYNHFFEHNTVTEIKPVVDLVIANNPCNLSRPEIKYPYMIKSLLYASYCGLTASTLWNGDTEVNGGFIKVKRNGEILAHYALESDAFKAYLFNNCYLEFPSTSENHGNYAKVYKKDDDYFFNLNFQIRYK